MASQPVSEATRELGMRVRARRRALGWSMERLADICGIHWSMVGQIERGQRNVGLHNILKLATALGVDPGELVRGLEMRQRGTEAAEADRNKPNCGCGTAELPNLTTRGSESGAVEADRPGRSVDDVADTST